MPSKNILTGKEQSSQSRNDTSASLQTIIFRDNEPRSICIFRRSLNLHKLQFSMNDSFHERNPTVDFRERTAGYLQYTLVVQLWETKKDLYKQASLTSTQCPTAYRLKFIKTEFYFRICFLEFILMLKIYIFQLQF